MPPSLSRSHPALPSEAVLEELRSLCDSDTFARAGEARRLLRFLVETEQAGRAEDLREVQIAAELYGREPSYDPKIDGIVRVNAARLRVRLEEHYAPHPKTALRIVLPKGSYVPLYIRTEAVALEAPPPVTVTAATVSNDELESVSRPATVADDAAARRTFYASRWVLAACALAVLATAGWYGSRTRVREPGSAVSWIARPFARLPGKVEYPSFSPDGRSVVFSWLKVANGAPVLYTQELAGDVPRPLLGEEQTGLRPAWSPDRTRLAYLKPNGAGSKQLVVRNMATGEDTIVTTLRDSFPWLCDLPKLSWSRNGRLLFTAAVLSSLNGGTEGADAGDRCSIVAVDPQTHTVTALTHSPPGTAGDLEATATPDGRSVAFLRQVSFGVLDVFSVGVNGGPEVQLTHDSRDIIGFDVEPGGRSLVLAARGTDGVARLTRRDMGSSTVTLLTDGSVPAALPVVSPTGAAIAFASYSGAANIYRTSGTGPSQTVIDGGYQVAPQLSPDGRRLAYASEKTGFFEIWISNADGSQPARLTRSDGIAALSPFWTPDGRSVVFECRDRKHSHICMVASDGTGSIGRLTQDDSDQLLPSVSRDGRFVYYGSNRSGSFQIYRQALSGGGDPEQVTRDGGERAVESRDGLRLYIVDAQKKPLTLRTMPTPGHADEEPGSRMLTTSLVLPPDSAWGVGPHGVIFSRRRGDRVQFVEVEDATGKQRVLCEAGGVEAAGQLSVSPDGGSIFYATKPTYSAEVDLLTPAK